MIQRKQHLWLLLSALLSAGLFLTDFYHTDTQLLRVNDKFVLFILSILLTLLPLVTIFMYKNRGMQKNLVWLTLVLTAGLLALMLFFVSNFNDGTSAPQNGTYWIGAVLPVISFILLIASLRGIRKDEKLIKSLDRLR